MAHKLRRATSILCIFSLPVVLLTIGIQNKTAAACTALPTTLGITTFTVNVPANGTYRFWAHMYSPSNGNDAFYMQVDQSYCQLTVGNTGISASQFKWVDYQNGSATNKINLSLGAGNHSFTLAGLDPSVGVDKIILAADATCVPSGDGANCTTASSDTGPIITPPANPGGGGSTNTPPSVSGTLSLPRAAEGSAVTYYLNGKPIEGTKLDTTKLADGKYTLKRVETDASGQSAEVTQEIIVDNHKTLSERALHAVKRPLTWILVVLLVLVVALMVVWRFKYDWFVAGQQWFVQTVLRKKYIQPANAGQAVVFTSHNSQKRPWWKGLFVLGFAVVGTTTLIHSFAATPSGVSYLTWNGSVANGASIVAKADAIGGKMVQFAAGAPVAPADPPETSANTCTSVSQYGITFTFNKSYPCGTFANGDYWVAPNSGDSGVVIHSMSPAASGGRHGWIVNPASRNEPYDSRLDNYNANLMPALPYTATGSKSIVKAISYSGTCGNDGSQHNPCLQTASVLTVLGSVPAGNGANIFRPPYFGTEKPLYTTTQLQTGLLPSRAPVAGAPSLASIQGRFQRVQLDHTDNWYGRYMHPRDNFTMGSQVHNYGSDIASDNNDAALRLMLNDSIAAKTPALINYVQAGTDWAYTVKGGIRYGSNGGHFVGRKLPAVFAAVLLNDQTLKDFIRSAPYGAFGDDGHVYYSSAAGRVLYGQNGCSGGEYDSARTGGSGARDCKDPVGMIDGGPEPGGEYQNCCVSMPYKASSLAARLLPGGQSTWNYDYFHQYVDRYVTFGAWTLPDPQNRFPSLHGASKNSGYYDTPFQKNMWNAYRSTLP